MNNNDHKTLLCMERYGGSFAACIASAAHHADAVNYQKLKSAFPDLWEQHEEIAEQLERKQAKEDGSLPQ